jgi:hypothetical protein
MAADVIQAQKQEFRIMRLYIQLVPKRDYLSFERTPRPEEVQEALSPEVVLAQRGGWTRHSLTRPSRRTRRSSPRFGIGEACRGK